jgi:molybdopterin synthase sulfur carrier subunit
MKVDVRYFASLREQLGTAEVFELFEGVTVGQLRDLLIARSETHAAALARSRTIRCAVNKVLSKEDALLSEGAEVAFFPPVTGG